MVAVWDKEQSWQVEHPDPIKAHFDAGDTLSLVPENGAFVALAVVVLILKHNDTIVQCQIDVDRCLGVGVVFSHPQTTTGIKRDPDGLLDLGFSSEHLSAKSGRQRHALYCVLWKRKRERRTFRVVGRFGGRRIVPMSKAPPYESQYQ